MRLVVDTSILIAGLLKASTTRRLLLDPALDLIIPEHALEEIGRHAPMIRQRTGLTREAFDLLLALLTAHLEIIPDTRLHPWLPQARRVFEGRDPGDTPFLAAAYAVSCDGIWSDDADFTVVTDVPVWTTARLLKHLHLA